jgi:hypothetical protein
MDNRGIPPHIWGIARNSYIQLKEKNVRQAIVISGESGAGEACWIFLAIFVCSSMLNGWWYLINYEM